MRHTLAALRTPLAALRTPLAARKAPRARAFLMVRRVPAKPKEEPKSDPEPEAAERQVVALKDAPLVDWLDSFHGLGQASFPKDVVDVLLAPIASGDIEIKPDGLLYLPEIKYRRILNRAFGPGGWGLAPRTETLITPKQVSREYALVCQGRLVLVARGEQDYFGGDEKLTTALEGCKSNALMRCCKDLGIASELWDPAFIRLWKKQHCDEAFAEHMVTKKKRKLWKLKTQQFEYPYKAC